MDSAYSEKRNYDEILTIGILQKAKIHNCQHFLK